MKTNPNDFAFENMLHNGMTKREYFASILMGAHVTNHTSVCALFYEDSKQNMEKGLNIARSALRMADSLIAALNEENKK